MLIIGSSSILLLQTTLDKKIIATVTLAYLPTYSAEWANVSVLLENFCSRVVTNNIGTATSTSMHEGSPESACTIFFVIIWSFFWGVSFKSKHLFQIIQMVWPILMWKKSTVFFKQNLSILYFINSCQKQIKTFCFNPFYH